MNPACLISKGVGWVYENHPDKSETLNSGCVCGAGAPCKCNDADGIDAPDVSRLIVEDGPQRRHYSAKALKTRSAYPQRGGRNSLASQPTASVCMGSTATEIFSMRSQVEHSNVRSSNPRVPGEIRAKAILCLHAGHIGRSLIKLPITVPQDHRQNRICCPLSK